MDFSIVVPTYKRKEDLIICVESILRQTKSPVEIIIVDDDNLSDGFVQKLKNNLNKQGIDLVYHQKDHKKNPRGSSESRNLGMEMASEEICFILDDDLILDNDFFEQIVSVWKDNEAESLIGVGGVIKNNRRRGRLEWLYVKIFGLGSDINWDVNDVGFQNWDDWIKRQGRGHYVHGGVCSYKKSVLDQLGGFTVRSGGRDALEDVDFCLRAKQVGYHFVIDPKAKVIHNHSPSGREDSLAAGFKEGYNRKRIFSDHCGKTFKNYLWFMWANTGWVLKQFITGQFKKGIGMIKGLLSR